MKTLAFFMLFLSLCNASYAADGDSPSSNLSSGAITDFIKSERIYLQGRHKVDLSREFLEKSSVPASRFGNLKNVLNLNGLSFSGENLNNVIFNMASMIDVNLSNAILHNSEFVSVDFTSADLANADFKKADLSNAHFENTNLEGAKFEGANLFRASFNKVKGLTKQQLQDLRKRTNSYINLEREPPKGEYD